VNKNPLLPSPLVVEKIVQKKKKKIFSLFQQKMSKDSSKLAIAAEELIKAACSHVESTSLTIGKETVEGLKKLSIGSSSIEKSVESLKTSMDSKLNTLNQSISNLKEEVVGLNSAVALQTKNQKLQWAISNAGLNSFSFYVKDGYNRVESTSFVKTILFSFRKGNGHYITNRSMTDYNRYGNNTEVQGEQQFRDALSAQIHELLGQKPLVAVDDNGYAIYYS
jgi:hypothetical protein